MQIKDLCGKKFGRLLVLARENNPGTRKNDTAAYWLCKCDCGSEKIIRGYSLTSGKTKSCSCLNVECNQLNQFKQAKLSHAQSVAKKLWKRSTRYSQIPFNQFLNLIQQNCYYCDSEPKLHQKSRRKDSQIFYYQTLDRMDRSFDHVIGNVVPCCLICNRAKLTRSVEGFKNYLNNIKNYQPKEPVNSIGNIKVDKLPQKQKTFVELIYKSYSFRKEMLIDVNQFYNLTQMNCYYCGENPSNRRKGYFNNSGEFDYIYNGLDRVNNDLPYLIGNVVPCCKYCNSAKGNLTLAEFEEWIIRIKNS